VGWRGCRIPSGPEGGEPRPAFIGRDSARATAPAPLWGGGAGRAQEDLTGKEARAGRGAGEK